MLKKSTGIHPAGVANVGPFGVSNREALPGNLLKGRLHVAKTLNPARLVEGCIYFI